MTNKPKPKPDLEVVNPMYQGATLEMVVLALLRPVEAGKKDDSDVEDSGD